MELEARAVKFMSEFIALCERHGAAILTDGERPAVFFTHRDKVARYLKWWQDKGSVIETDEFKDYLE